MNNMGRGIRVSATVTRRSHYKVKTLARLEDCTVSHYIDKLICDDYQRLLDNFGKESIYIKGDIRQAFMYNITEGTPVGVNSTKQTSKFMTANRIRLKCELDEDNIINSDLKVSEYYNDPFIIHIGPQFEYNMSDVLNAHLKQHGFTLFDYEKGQGLRYMIEGDDLIVDIHDQKWERVGEVTRGREVEYKNISDGYGTRGWLPETEYLKILKDPDYPVIISGTKRWATK
jgi:hypothetical protein